MSEKNETPAESSKPTPKDNLVITHHTVTVSGQEIRYTVTTGTIVLKEEITGKGEKEGQSEGEKPKAEVFFIAYSKDDADKSKRPITFSFNGGPGSSSVWLHLGLLGPKRVYMRDTENTPPPYALVENEYSLLDLTDLVFIDPVSTGYSRVVPGETAKDFHGFKKDIESVGDFIRLYTSRYGRWQSPKFLIGESYGTTRAAGLSGYLQERHGMYLNGLMLVSSVLDFQTLDFFPENDLPYILFLPTYTATAWYHKKLGSRLQRKPLRKVLDEVETFALGEYAAALMKGSSLPRSSYKIIQYKLSEYTGLSETYLDYTHLRIHERRFFKELLRSEKRTVGRLDSRFTGIDRDSAGETTEFDPSFPAIQGPYTATFNHYVREDLKFESDIPYEVIVGLYNNWSYKEFENRYVSVSDTLRKAIHQNPYLKIFVANGYYDLATPHFATEYTFSHLGLAPELRQNITMGYYEAGHMMYVHLDSLARLKRDLEAFVLRSVPTSSL
jgi:carboxypeptidase C (cathepsin A)